MVLSQESTGEEYSTLYVLPYYQIASIIKKDIASNNKSLLHKIINGKVLFDNLDFIVKVQDYVHFLLKQRKTNIDFLFVRKQLSEINNNIKEYNSLQNPHLKEIHLSTIKQITINLYDNLYFDKEKIVTQIEKSNYEIEKQDILSIAKLLKLTSKTNTKKLEKIVTNLISQIPIFSYYQSINSIKNFEATKQLFVILKTIYPYEDIIFDLKTTFERITQSKLYAKYDSTRQQVVFEIMADNKDEKDKSYAKFTNVLQKYLDKSKTTFKILFTDNYPDIWAFELNDSKMKQIINNDLHLLMFVLKKHWTQDYAVSVALIIIVKILHALYKNESECSNTITMLYENWFIFLFEDYTSTNIYQFNKNKEFRTASLVKQVESMNNDMALLTGFIRNEEINQYIRHIQEIIISVIKTQSGSQIEKENTILGLFEEICSSLGVYKKNLPYIALLIKTYREYLWKII